MSYSRVDYKWDQRQRSGHSYQLSGTENYNYWPNFQMQYQYPVQGNRYPVQGSHSYTSSSFQRSYRYCRQRMPPPPLIPPLLPLPPPPRRNNRKKFGEQGQQDTGPISKESRDTLRNRIRNENQLQEEKEKEHQDQVKDKVRQLQKKLTSTDLNITISENGKEPAREEPASSTSANHGRSQPNLSETATSSSTHTPVKSVVNKKNKLSKKASNSSNKKFKRNKPCEKSTKKYKKKDSASSKKKQIPKPSRDKLNAHRSKDSVTKKGHKTSNGDRHYEQFKVSVAKKDPKPCSKSLNYDRFKSSIAKKDPKYLKELIESPSFLKKVLMTKLVEEHRKQISDKLNQLRFNDTDEKTKSKEWDSDKSDPFFQVEFKDLPTDFISEISNLIVSQKQSQQDGPSHPSQVTTTSADLPSSPTDEDIIEVPVPPKTPPPCFDLDLSDSEEVNEKPESECIKKVFADKVINEIEILNREEKTLKEKLEVLTVERNNLIQLLANISETRNKLLMESASLLKSS